MAKKKISKQPKISGKKKLLYNLISGVVIPILVLLFIELILRIAGYGSSHRLFIKHPDKEYKGYLIVNPEIGKKYFHKVEYTSPPNDLFKSKKEDNIFRIFVMGSSTVVGFPYSNNLMFSRILHCRLQEAYPEKNVEVINTAITAVNSYTLQDYAKQIVKYEPDAVLIYAGHNEFYGALGVGSLENSGSKPGLVRLHLKMMNIRIYQLLQNIIHNLASKTKQETKQSSTLMKRIVKNSSIIYQSDEYKAGVEQFRQNMELLINKLTNHDVPVYLSTLVSNIHDLPPFESVETSNQPAAIDVFKKAKSAELNGDNIQARNLYNYARDLDCIRFRASSEINNIIAEIAEKPGVTLVPMLEIFEKNSSNAMIGSSLLTEHVHPNYKGYFLMADAFFNSIVGSKIIAEQPNMYSMHSPAYNQLNWGFTILDTLIAHHRITNLSYHWPFRPEDAPYMDYRILYKPISYIDSVAFSVLTSSDINTDYAHLMMEEYYKKKGDILNAFHEANALVMMNPARSANLRRAADYLLQLNDLPGALSYFRKSLIFEKTFYAYFKSGEIYLMLNDMDNAIYNFEQAEQLSDNRTLANVRYKLYLAYSYGRRTDKAQQLAQKLQQINPQADLRLPVHGNKLMDYIPYQIMRQVNQAKQLLQENKLDDAMNLLLQAVEINDSPVANRLLAEIYYHLRKGKASEYFFKKSYVWFKTDPRFLHNYFLLNLALENNEEAANCLKEIKYIAPNYGSLKSLEDLLNKSLSN